MKTATCNRCGMTNLIWQQSKKGKWYLAVEKTWQGDMTGSIRSFYPAHNCVVQESEPRNESYYFDHQDGRFI